MSSESLPRRLARWASLVESSAERYAVEPLLVFAVMDRESLGGEALRPPGPGGVGDGGHGRGLMQIDDRANTDWVRVYRWWDPATNIAKGTQILADCLTRFKTELPPAIAAYNAGAGAVAKVLAKHRGPELLAALNSITTGGDYVSDVLARMDSFKAPSNPQQKVA